MTARLRATSSRARRAKTSTSIGRSPLPEGLQRSPGRGSGATRPCRPPPSRIGVRTTPGHRALTRRPWAAPRRAARATGPPPRSWSPRRARPAACGRKAAIEAVLTTWPKPCSIIRGQAARTPWTHAHQVDLDRLPPVLEREVADLAAHGDPGVVEEVVEAAAAGEDVRDERVRPRAGVAHVESRALGAAARGVDPSGLGPGVLSVAVGEDDEGAPPRQLAPEGGPDPRGAARDERRPLRRRSAGPAPSGGAGHERLSPSPAGRRTAPSRTRPPGG